VRAEYHKVKTNQGPVTTVKVNGAFVEDFIPEGEEYDAIAVNPVHLQ